MQDLNIYSIQDKTAERFGPIFEAVNDAVASRQCGNIMQKIPPEYREEYKLCRIGSINPFTGIITPLQTPLEVDFIFKTLSSPSFGEVSKMEANIHE